MLVSTVSKSRPVALSAVGLFWLSISVANAAPVPNGPSACNRAAFDRKADLKAKEDLNQAIAAVDAGRLQFGRDRLERAETVLLNREVVDLGAAFSPEAAVPKSGPIARIVNARQALNERDLSRAVQDARQAVQRLDAELATAPSR